jgi:tRNA (cmo5U34)-methyltransferase
MLSMAAILLAERAAEDARMPVLGAVGGLELKAFAQAQPRWTFDAVDPSAPMLALAKQTLGPFASRRVSTMAASTMRRLGCSTEPPAC